MLEADAVLRLCCLGHKTQMAQACLLRVVAYLNPGLPAADSLSILTRPMGVRWYGVGLTHKRARGQTPGWGQTPNTQKVPAPSRAVFGNLGQT